MFYYDNSVSEEKGADKIFLHYVPVNGDPTSVLVIRTKLMATEVP